jgi:SpoVK/Ycf46/Vps4 family AAA+-type ATPase
VTKRQHVEMTISNEEIKLLVQHLAGLTLMESEKILIKAIIEDGKLAVDDIRHVIEAKVAVVEKDGLLEYYPVEAALWNIADLRSLKAWLAKRKAAVTEPGRAEEFGLNFPRGMLLLGVPGCGKNLSVKAVAAEWRMPLLKLDPSNLYNKYTGESEGNFKRAMRTAEQIAPVVLWIDELEKAFAAGGGSPSGSWEAFSRGCRTALATCSSWPPPTTSAGSLPSFYGRVVSTRSFSSISRMRPRGQRSFKSIWKTAVRTVGRSTWSN